MKTSKGQVSLTLPVWGTIEMIVQVEQASRRDDIAEYFGDLDYRNVTVEKWDDKTEDGYVVTADNLDVVLNDIEYKSFVVSRPQQYHYDAASWVVKIYNNYIE